MSNKKVVTRINKALFEVRTLPPRPFQLILNFNPLIERFKLSGNYQLIHWQARPKGSREWGIYNSKDDSYRSLEDFELQGKFKSLQIPDSEAKSIPSAVLLYQK